MRHPQHLYDEVHALNWHMHMVSTRCFSSSQALQPVRCCLRDALRSPLKAGGSC